MEKQRLDLKGGPVGIRLSGSGSPSRTAVQSRPDSRGVASENLPLSFRHVAGGARTGFPSSQPPQTSGGLVPGGQMGKLRQRESSVAQSRQLMSWRASVRLGQSNCWAPPFITPPRSLGAVTAGPQLLTPSWLTSPLVLEHMEGAGA